MTLALISSGCATTGRMWESLTNTVEGETPKKWVRQMEDPDFADERRAGITKLVKQDYARRPPYTTRYRQIAELDSDYTVRAAAIRALNISRDASATPTFIRGLNDKSDLVRLEAAKALANIPDPNAAADLTRVLQNPAENKDVRIAAADALRHYADITVARTLAGTLGAREFGIAWQARRSLRTMTRQDFHYDEAAWLQYLTTAKLG
jgi:hypothetical protein